MSDETMRKSSLFRALVLACAVWLWPGSVGAAMMEHYDLSSLALMSDAVVLARKTGERAIDPYRTATTHRVLKVYRGGLRPGDVVEVEYGAYSMSPMWGWGTDAGTPVVSNDVILFLHRGSVYLPDGGSQDAWLLAPSGLRIFADGAAYRFEQFNNPGPYEPVPQGLDPYDVLRDPRGTARLDLAAFEAVLARALGRADAVKDAIAKLGTSEKAALDLIGPAPGVDDGTAAALRLHDFYEDRAAVMLLEALAVEHRIDAFLEGFARTSSPVSTFRLRHSFTLAELLTAALDRNRPLAHRAAALELAHGQAFNRAKPSDDKAVIALLEDPDPEIRARALYVDFDDPGLPASVRAAIEKRWSVEHEPRVVYALLDHAPRPAQKELNKHAAEMPVAWVRRQRRSISVAWAWLDPQRAVSLKRLSVEVRAKDRVVKRLTLFPNAASGPWGGTSSGGYDGYLDFDQIAVGNYDLGIELELEDAAHHATTRRIAMGPYHSAPGPSVVPPAPSAPPPAPSAVASPPVPAVTPGQRASSCACGAALRATPERGAVAIVAWLGLALARRRRRRTAFADLGLPASETRQPERRRL